MPNKAYNYDFRLYLEGVHVPFVSANIIATPNGVEANINLHADKTAYDLKPKTAVQIFYKDWVPVDGIYGWRLMFDGYLSSYIKDDQADQGRSLGIVCRDFRMDIRKTPAALAYDKVEGMGVINLYHRTGLKSKFAVPGVTQQSGNDNGIPIRTFNEIANLSYMISLIAGTAFGKLQENTSYVDQKNGENQFVNGFGNAPEDEYNNGEGAFYLDAIVRGIWLEAVGGTSPCAFMNKRIRADKKIVVPKNNTGFNFWKKSNAGINVGTAMMGDAIFTSVEASIMRVAGMFLTRVYSCPTPSLINIGKEEVSKWVIHPDVKKFLIDRESAKFGAKYILNETMLLPPMEFTSPPNCNLILPPMYDRVNWQYDMDSDFTRGYFNVIDTFSTPSSDDPFSLNVQIPTSLFTNTIYEGDEKDRYGARKPPLTLEERYNGVNVYYGSVQEEIAKDDSVSQVCDIILNQNAAKKYSEESNKLINKKLEIENRFSSEMLHQSLSRYHVNLLDERLRQIEETFEQQDRGKTNNPEEEIVYYVEEGQVEKRVRRSTAYSIERHALIKYLNLRYAGRVAVVDMAFNPYIMCGFPGAIVSDERGAGKNSTKTIIGMVQQVKHMILISQSGGNATTSAVLNNARFDDEPTDMDSQGNPLYMAETNPYGPTLDENNEINPSYSIPEPKTYVRKQANDEFYDLDEKEKDPLYIYAKDFLTLTDKDIANGERNNTYLDRSYEPNRISKFYDDVFGHNSIHFMSSGKFTDVTETVTKYAFDTIHEGLDKLKKDHNNLMSEYEDCINYVRRNVCSADAFFQGILGLSRLKNNGEYVNVQDDFKDDEIDEEYYGVTTELFNSGDIDGLKTKYNYVDEEHFGVIIGKSGHMDQPGLFSSIREHMPITAFIYERHQLVKQYLEAVSKQIQGVQFANYDG